MRLQSMPFAALIASLVVSAVSAQEPLAQELDLALKVSVHPNIKEKDESIQQAYQKVADQLAAPRIGVPDDRLRYFQSHPSPKHVPLTGWGGMIESITPQPNRGLIVLLSVQPRYSGPSTSLLLYERYLIAGGKAKYLGNALHPSATYPYVEIN